MSHLSPPEPRFEHLLHLTTELGIFEHSLVSQPRLEHGYCLDDVSRALLVTTRQPGSTATLRGAMRAYLAFIEQAQSAEGAFRNRRRTDGTWSDQPSTDDHWGRALWAAGSTARIEHGYVAARALAIAERAMRQRSPWPRSMAYAALGAAEVLHAHPRHPAARKLLIDAGQILRPHQLPPSWPWPESRLRYANAVLPEALVAIGAGLGERDLMSSGLAQLEWLLELQTSGDHLSVIPAGGWGPGDPLPGFDQQPIEVAALAEACWRAYEATGEPDWLSAVDLCASWFLGNNDAGISMYNHSTGGCSDGLHADAANRNQGAESTLAALSTLQLARRAVLAVAA